MRKISLTLVCALMVSAAFAQQEQPPHVKVESPHVRGLEVVTDGFTIRATFQNDTDSLVLLKGIELELPDQFVGGEREKVLKFKKGALSVEGHASQETDVEIPAVSFKRSLVFLLFQARPYEATIRFTEEDPANRGFKPREDVVAVPLNAQSAYLPVVLGGLIGVPIVILFFKIYDKYQGQGSSGKPFWISLLLGWLVVVIAVFVFRFSATQIPQLPIAVQVKDFYGGLLVGGCFEPLARSLAKIRNA